ncbi:MAG: hypothetical protein ACTSWQ_04430 [Candidatus Thorarchaeota archaeon]
MGPENTEIILACAELHLISAIAFSMIPKQIIPNPVKMKHGKELLIVVR